LPILQGNTSLIENQTNTEVPYNAGDVPLEGVVELGRVVGEESDRCLRIRIVEK